MFFSAVPSPAIKDLGFLYERRNERPNAVSDGLMKEDHTFGRAGSYSWRMRVRLRHEKVFSVLTEPIEKGEHLEEEIDAFGAEADRREPLAAYS
jgi:hypothetical protein